LNRRPVVRTLLASAAIAAAIALAGCQSDGTTPTGKAMKPLSDKMIADLERRDMPKTSPILVRIFKQEAELEVWKQDSSGRYALLKSYPICRWSGELGPKIKQGDRQAPEGFYNITPGQMNPNSSYYLSFNLGYPNAFDRSHGRTGTHLMVHGDCSSAGCYAMTDEQIQEIYALGRESFFGGQRSFQVQAYPFHMTPANMAKHRNNPHMAFWKMLKQGHDHFEVTRLEPKVDVCEKRYVFNASPQSGNFSPAAACPVYEVPKAIETAVNDKQRQDEFQTAQLISRGTATAPITTGTDGGMHPVFLAKLGRQAPPSTADGSDTRAYTPISVPGTLPAHVNPPREPEVVTASTAKPEPSYRVASADPNAASTPTNAGSGNMFGSLFSSGDQNPPATKDKNGNVLDRMGRWIGLGGSEPKAAAAPPAPKPKPAVVRSANAAPGAIRPKQDGAGEAPKANAGAIPAQPPAESRTASAQGGSAGLMTGSTPIVPTNSFDSRFSAFR
jgi:murein L,D-transpeptidase YafK